MYCFTNASIHTVFLTTVIDPSHSFRMTINISLIMTPCRPVSF